MNCLFGLSHSRLIVLGTLITQLAMNVKDDNVVKVEQPAVVQRVMKAAIESPVSHPYGSACSR